MGGVLAIELLQPLASYTFRPSNWLREGRYVASETASSQRTTAVSAPSTETRSAAISLRTTCPGLCLICRRQTLSRLPANFVARKTP